MAAAFDPALLAYLTDEERAELDSLLTSDKTLWRPLPGPQTMAYESQADIIGYGGAAGGEELSFVGAAWISGPDKTRRYSRSFATTNHSAG